MYEAQFKGFFNFLKPNLVWKAKAENMCKFIYAYLKPNLVWKAKAENMCKFIYAY
jgi:hypothetical protein